MIYIQNGRDRFYQWDLNQHLVVENEDIKQLHFTNALITEALITEVIDGVAAVPNILLQTDWDIVVYGTCGECVRDTAKFKVEPRIKPSDYVYTETETLNYEALEKRVAALEEAGPGNVDLDDYYTKSETETKIQEAQPDLSGYALKSEIPETPDLSGYALKTDIPDTSNFATKDEIPEEQDLSGYALKSEIPDVSNFITEEDIPEVKIATAANPGIVKPDGITITVAEDGTISSLGNPSDGSIKEWVWVPVNGLNFTLAANTRHLKIVCHAPFGGSTGKVDGEEYAHTLCLDCFSSTGFNYESRFYPESLIEDGYTIEPIMIRNDNGAISFYGEYSSAYAAPYYRRQLTTNDLIVDGYYYWGGSELLTQEDLDSQVNLALEDIENGSY